MAHRLVNLPSSTENYSKELDTIKRLGKVDGYNENVIDRIVNKLVKKKELRNFTTLETIDERDESPVRRSVVYYPMVTKS